MATERSCKILPDERSVQEARRFAELALHSCDPRSREAATMAVSELAENIVKYGLKTESVFAGSISISVENGMIRVRATNAVSSERDVNEVKESIAQIAAAQDLTALYRSRLAQLFANPHLSRAQLGLLRVALEGGFRLFCSYERPTLLIVAERVASRQ